MEKQYHVAILYDNILNMPYYFNKSNDIVENIGFAREYYPGGHIDREVFRTNLELKDFIENLYDLCNIRSEELNYKYVSFDPDDIEEYKVHMDEDITTYAELEMEDF